MKIRIEALDQGDEVIGFVDYRLIIKKKNGEVEIVHLVFDENGIPRTGDKDILITFKSGSLTKISIADEASDFEVGSF